MELIYSVYSTWRDYLKQSWMFIISYNLIFTTIYLSIFLTNYSSEFQNAMGITNMIVAIQMSIQVGALIGFETLGSQNKDNLPIMHNLFKLSYLIISIITVPMLIITWKLDWIASFFISSTSVLHLVKLYSFGRNISMLMSLCYAPIWRYLNIRNILRPVLYGSILGFSIFVIATIINNMLWSKYHSDISIFFVGLNLGLVYLIPFIFFLIYQYMYKIIQPEDWSWSLDFTIFSTLFGKTLPGILMVFLEFSFLQISGLFASVLDSNQLNSYVVGINLSFIVISICSFFNYTISSKVGAVLGTENAENARKLCYHSLIGATFIITSIVAVYGLFCYFLSKYIVNTPEIMTYWISSLPLIIISTWLRIMVFTFNGAIRAIGAQKYISYFNIFNYYLIFVPILYYRIKYCSDGVLTIWIVISSSWAFNLLAQILTLIFVKWEKVIKSDPNDPTITQNEMEMIDETSNLTNSQSEIEIIDEVSNLTQDLEQRS